MNETDIIGATVAGIVRLKVKDPVKIPTNLVAVDLEKNYVSSGWKEEIIDVIDGLKALKITFNDDGNISFKANDVIKNNSGRRDKKLWSDRGVGDVIEYYRATDGDVEATYVADKISYMHRDAHEYHEFAVL